MVFCLKLYFVEWKLVEFSLLVGKEEEMVGEDGSIAIKPYGAFRHGRYFTSIGQTKNNQVPLLHF
jgi:hypothetical protein